MPYIFKRNKQKRFEALYRTYAKNLYVLSLRYVANSFDAEEVVQRAFIKVFEKLDAFKEENEQATKGWLNRIVINESLLLMREQKRIQLNDDTTFNEPYTDSLPDTDLSYQECLSLVRNLPDGYRAVFNLYVIEGYSHKEIAAMLYISEASSRSQLTRARAYLQKQIKQLNYETEVIR
nr:sigma-70 family RNA polymerase sigma factor [uncultured Carboxylicivirga sp.]